jgi:hypothetical protein
VKQSNYASIVRTIFNYIRLEMARGKDLNAIERDLFKQGVFNGEAKDAHGSKHNIKSTGAGHIGDFIFPFWL